MQWSWAADWLVSPKSLKCDLHWELVVRSLSHSMHIFPLFVTVGCTCGGGGAPRRQSTLHFSGWAQGQEHIWFTGRFGASHVISVFHTRTHTHKPTCCCAARVKAAAAAGVHKQQSRHTGALPTQTNKHTCCSRQVALTISRRREGKQNKQFNLHDSNLLYISMPWQWWSEALLEAASNEKWWSYKQGTVSTGGSSSQR